MLLSCDPLFERAEGSTWIVVVGIVQMQVNFRLMANYTSRQLSGTLIEHFTCFRILVVLPRYCTIQSIFHRPVIPK